MKIEELFRRDINRVIEEVIKVDLGDEDIIVDELDEYVATEHIIEELETVLDAYQESIHNPNETCTVWVSGFFGSGKSSWAKVLGYLLWNPNVAGQSATERFFGRTSGPRLRALLNTIHAQSPTLAVLLNLATGSNVVAKEGESVVLPDLPGVAGTARLLARLHDWPSWSTSWRTMGSSRTSRTLLPPSSENRGGSAAATASLRSATP